MAVFGWKLRPGCGRSHATSIFFIFFFDLAVRAPGLSADRPLSLSDASALRLLKPRAESEKFRVRMACRSSDHPTQPLIFSLPALAMGWTIMLQCPHFFSLFIDNDKRLKYSLPAEYLGDGKASKPSHPPISTHDQASGERISVLPIIRCPGGGQSLSASRSRSLTMRKVARDLDTMARGPEICLP
jgi:hypothetical protein